MLTSLTFIVIDLLHIIKTFINIPIKWLVSLPFHTRTILKTYYKDKLIVVTGASSGIGATIAASLHELGSHIIISSRSVDKLQELKLILEKKGPSTANIHIIPLDLEKYEDFSAYKKEIQNILSLNNYNGIDVLINNAGVASRGDAISTSLETLTKIMAVNFFGPVEFTKAILPFMIQKDKSCQRSITIISSVQGKFGIPYRTSYGASKHAVQGYFDSLRSELIPHNINVTIISPGYVNTELSNNAITPDGSKYGIKDKSTANGMSPQYVTNEVLISIARGDVDVVIGNTMVNVAIQLKTLFPDIWAWIISKMYKS